MNKLIGLLLASLFMLGMQTQAFAVTAQQNKMKTCNAEAKTKVLKGDERKAFMKDCLSAKSAAATSTTSADAAAPAAPATTSQKDKMKACNADAKTKALKGAERKAFMKDCLSAEKK